MRTQTVTYRNPSTGETFEREITVYDSDCVDSPDRPGADLLLGKCSGEVFARLSYSGATRTDRCEGHYHLYADRIQPIMDSIARRYPQQAPDDFDPTYAGESWDEDY